MWRRVWSLAPILLVSGSFSLSSVSTIDCVPVEGGRHVEEGLELGPHLPGEQVLLLVQRLHYIVYLLKVAAMWRRVWNLAPILLVSSSYSLSSVSTILCTC